MCNFYNIFYYYNAYLSRVMSPSKNIAYMMYHYLLLKHHLQTCRFHAEYILPARIGASIFVFFLHFDISPSKS